MSQVLLGARLCYIKGCLSSKGQEFSFTLPILSAAPSMYVDRK